MNHRTPTRRRTRPRFRPPEGPAAAAQRNLGEGWTLRTVQGRPGTNSAGAMLLTADPLAALDWLVHGFSTRRGGLGLEPFNLGFTEGASPQKIEENRREFVRAAIFCCRHDPSRRGYRSRADEQAKPRETKSVPLVVLRQIHSDISQSFTVQPKEIPQCDAAMTARAGLVLGVQTADCVPILLADRARRVVAAVHAGWRGTLARVAQKAIGRMRLEFGSDPRDIVAAIGPSIGGCCYEVGPEIAQAFAGQFAQAREWFSGPFDRLALGEEPNPLPWLTMMPPGHQPPPERVWLDLRAANHWQLTAAGVLPSHITTSSLCTACSTDLLFSYRREGARAGRMMAVIGVLREPAKSAAKRPSSVSPKAVDSPVSKPGDWKRPKANSRKKVRRSR